jgi:hypothetical protein
MTFRFLLGLLSATALLTSPGMKAQQAAPPFQGTAFLDANIITERDASAFIGVRSKGTGLRTNFDRRVNAFRQINVSLFDALYADAPAVEVQVNSEFGRAEAEAVAAFYARATGQLPRSLRNDVRELWIHRGNEAFGGGNRSILIHTGTIAEQYLRDGMLEEVLMHEAVHTSLDATVSTSPAWLAAQRSDPSFISTYAQQNPTREDVAETFNTWFALRYRSDRLPAAMLNQIRAAVPARLAAFDALNLDLRPSLTKAQESDNYWITGLGPMQGRDLVISDALFSSGTSFGAGFNPADVRRTRWGSLSFRFLSCNEAEVSWSPVDARFAAGRYRLERIAANAGQRACEANPNAPAASWVSGTWWGGGARSGEGFLIDALEGGQVFVAWFTYGAPR